MKRIGRILIAVWLLAGSLAAAVDCATASTVDGRASAALHLLDSPQVADRLAALQQIEQLGPAAAAAVPAIVDILNQNNPGAARNLMPQSRPAPQLLVASLRALAAIGSAAREAAPYLVSMLDDPRELLRREQVLVTLNSIGLDDSAAPTVMKVVTQEGKFTNTRLLAIRLLGEMEPPAVEALDLLKEISADQTDSQARAAALQAISSISQRSKPTDDATAKKEAKEGGGASALRAQLAADKPKAQRLEALDKIGDLGAGSRQLVPLLIQLLKDNDHEIVGGTADALAEVGTGAASAAPALVTQYFSQKDEAMRSRFARAIAAVDPSGKATLPLLRPMLEDPFRARLAITILDELGTDQARAIASNARRRWCLK